VPEFHGLQFDFGLEPIMADEKSHTEEGQIERAQRLRQKIENLKEGTADDQSSSEGKSLKEQIDERSRKTAPHQNTSDSE
jgi:hypothetical protein